MSTSNLYPVLIGLSLIVTNLGAYMEKQPILIAGLSAAMFFLSLQIGVILHQYRGMAKLLDIHNGLIIASLKAQGFEIEGSSADMNP